MKRVIPCFLHRNRDQAWLFIRGLFSQRCWSKWVHLALTGLALEPRRLMPQAVPQHQVDILNHHSNDGNKPSEVSLPCEGLFRFGRQVSPLGVCFQGLQVEPILRDPVVPSYLLFLPLFPLLPLSTSFLWASSCWSVTSVKQFLGLLILWLISPVVLLQSVECVSQCCMVVYAV